MCPSQNNHHHRFLVRQRNHTTTSAHRLQTIRQLLCWFASYASSLFIIKRHTKCGASTTSLHRSIYHLILEPKLQPRNKIRTRPKHTHDMHILMHVSCRRHILFIRQATDTSKTSLLFYSLTYLTHSPSTANAARPRLLARSRWGRRAFKYRNLNDLWVVAAFGGFSSAAFIRSLQKESERERTIHTSNVQIAIPRSEALLGYRGE